jgi:hypothetical protein
MASVEEVLTILWAKLPFKLPQKALSYDTPKPASNFTPNFASIQTSLLFVRFVEKLMAVSVVEFVSLKLKLRLPGGSRNIKNGISGETVVKLPTLVLTPVTTGFKLSPGASLP